MSTKKNEKEKVISFINTKEVRHQNFYSLKRIANKAKDFFEQHGIHMNRHVEYPDKENGTHVSAYLRESNSSHGFRFTLLHEKGLTIKSIHYTSADFVPANCTEITSIITADDKGRIVHTKRFNDKAIQNLFEIILKAYKAEAHKFN